jgi:hypothetical protein
VKRSDIADDHVLELARAWRESPLGAGVPGVIEALVREGVPEKVALAKVMHMCDRRLLEYGTSPYHAWPA